MTSATPSAASPGLTLAVSSWLREPLRPKPSTGRDCQRRSMRGLVQTVRGCPLASTAVGGDYYSLGYSVSCEWRPLTNRELARGAKRCADPHIPRIAGSAAWEVQIPIAGHSRVAGTAGALSPPPRVCWVGSRHSTTRRAADGAAGQRCQLPAASAACGCSTSSPSIAIWISSLTTIRPSRMALKLSPKSFLLILVVAP